MDISEHMVNIARSKHTANTEFHVMCSTESKLPETLQQKFDLVTSFWVMQVSRTPPLTFSIYYLFS